MVIKRLRQIKSEIRVIGVAVQCDPVGVTIIGVVFRGRLWLDGVLKTRSAGVDVTEAVSEMIKRSQHYGQIRVILLSRISLPMEVKISSNSAVLITACTGASGNCSAWSFAQFATV